jgi:hypothetical protein
MRWIGCYRGGDLEDRWGAAVEFEKYDFIHEVVFEHGGQGNVASGSGQHLIEDVEFDYAVDGSVVTLTFRGEEEGRVRSVRYDVDEGVWTFRMETPMTPTTTRCHRRITFAASPFPYADGDRIFYADCQVERE